LFSVTCLVGSSVTCAPSLVAAFAALSASSLPRTPACAGTHLKWIARPSSYARASAARTPRHASGVPVNFSPFSIALSALWLSDAIHVQGARVVSIATWIAFSSADRIEHVSSCPIVIEIGGVTIGPDMHKFRGKALTTPIPQTPFRTEASVYNVGPLRTILSAWIASSGVLAISISGWSIHGAGPWSCAPVRLFACIARSLPLCSRHASEIGVSWLLFILSLDRVHLPIGWSYARVWRCTACFSTFRCSRSSSGSRPASD
jgi:hypothetical protein